MTHQGKVIFDSIVNALGNALTNCPCCLCHGGGTSNPLSKVLPTHTSKVLRRLPSKVLNLVRRGSSPPQYLNPTWNLWR